MSKQSAFRRDFLVQCLSWNDFSEAQAQFLASCAVAQADFESTRFTSNLAVRYNNPIGYTYYRGSRWQSGPASDQPEEPGYNPYAAFPSLEFAACELADWIHRRKAVFAHVKSTDEYADAMKQFGYFRGNLGHYKNGLALYFQDPDGDFSEDLPALAVGTLKSVFKPPRVYWFLGIAFLAVFYFMGNSLKKLFRLL